MDRIEIDGRPPTAEDLRPPATQNHALLGDEAYDSGAALTRDAAIQVVHPRRR